MGRIGNKPIILPANVKVAVKENEITITGPAGSVKKKFDPGLSIVVENNVLSVRKNTEAAEIVQGTIRSIINGMVQGTLNKFEKKLELQGVGYKAQLAGRKITLLVGYSHPVEFEVPQDVEITVDPKGLQIVLKSCDKEKIGFFASQIRMSKDPDPYKGKGVRYAGEHIRKKPGKSAVGAGTAGGAAGGAKK